MNTHYGGDCVGCPYPTTLFPKTTTRRKRAKQLELDVWMYNAFEHSFQVLGASPEKGIVECVGAREGAQAATCGTSSIKTIPCYSTRSALGPPTAPSGRHQMSVPPVRGWCREGG